MNAPVETTEEPVALVDGEPLTLPEDLYIPPDALAVILESFEGPLDLLLYLIRKQNLDILHIPIARVTAQYMEYIRVMREMRFELAAEYLAMAAWLAEIKSRMLLPRPQTEDDEEEDPRAELVRRLQEYARFRRAAEDIDALPRQFRDIHTLSVEPPPLGEVKKDPDVGLAELVDAFRGVLKRASMHSHHHIQREELSVRERMSLVLSRLEDEGFTRFESLFDVEEGRAGVVVTFLAVLELLKEHLVEVVQREAFDPLYVKAGGS